MRRLVTTIAIVALVLSSSLFLFTCVSNSDSENSVSDAFRAVTSAGAGFEFSIDKCLNFVPSAPYLQSSHPVERMGDKSAFAYFKDEKILVGWNLGNTLDAYRSGGLASERAWNNPYANQEIMNGVKAAGFDIIRIPVTWMGHIGPAPDHRVGEERMKRVGEVVDMAHNAGLKVIINMHHDGVTESKEQESGWLSITKSTFNEDEFQAITWRYLRVWTQIAEYFKNYGDWLMFESLNEIHDGSWGEGSAFGLQRQFKILDQWNQGFSDVVRHSGANNASRYLVIPAYCTKAHHTVADTFVLPKDNVSNKQVITFHYYDPSDFAISGRSSTWGSDLSKQRMDKDFAPFKPRFIDKQIPVIIGEIGAIRQLYDNNKEKEDVARTSRLAYLSFSFATAKKYGLIPVYWDNGAFTGSGEKYGLFNRNDGTPNSDESKACIDAMIKAAK